jgi:hypothetical protein
MLACEVQLGQNVPDLIDAQYHRQSLGLARAEQVENREGLAQGVLKQEFERREGHGCGRAGEVFLGGEIEEREAQFFLADAVGRFVVGGGQLPNRADRGVLGFGGETAQLHVFEHPPS